MAKNSALKMGGPARVRLVVLDAEIADGDLSSLTQALQNALRSPATVMQRNTSSNASKIIAYNPEPVEEIVEANEEIDESPVVHSAPSSKQRTPRKVPTAPNVIEIEMNAELSFASFAAGKKADSWHKKYLIAAAWLHEHRNIPAVTGDHIYTCFRSIGWPTNVADFSQPLRQLKTRKFFTTPERGHYAINHIGLDYVKKLGGEDGVG